MKKNAPSTDRALVKKLREALDKMVWRERPEFPGDPYCQLCGAGYRWSRRHGHQDKCALFEAK